MSRKPLRTITVPAPSWSDEPVKMREPTIAEWRRISAVGDDQERTIQMLGIMVLGEDGNSVGLAEVEAAGVTVLTDLAKHIPGLIGQGSSDDPLKKPTDSTTGSPLPSVG